MASRLFGGAVWLLARVPGELAAERNRWPLWLPVAFGAGVAIYFALPAEPPWWLGASTLALCATAAAAWRGRLPLLLMAIVAATMAAGVTASQIRTVAVNAPYLDGRIGPVSIVGQILEVEPRTRGVRVVMQRLQIPGITSEATPERVRILVTAKLDRLRPGDWVRMTAVLRPPSDPAAPGAFDFARQAYFQRLGAVGFALGAPRLLDRAQATNDPEENWGDAWRIWWSELRQEIAARIGRTLPGATGAVAAALMTGARGAIPPAVIDAMRDSGLAHLLAISGLHLGLVTGLVFFTVRLVLAAVPALALRYPIKKWAAVGAALGGFGYLFLVGATVPTQRAYVMVGIVLLAVVLDRTAFTMRLVAWAALLVLAIAPESLLGPSFQMSFAAVAALVAGYEVVSERGRLFIGERTLGRRAALYIAALALTSLIAMAATAPFAIYHFNRFAIYGLAANLVAVPVTAFWIMPWALVAFLLMPFGLERLALIPMGWGVDLVIGTAEWVASWPGAVTLVSTMPTVGLVMVALGGVWLCLWRRPWRLAGVALIVAGLISGAFTQHPDLLVSGDGRLLAVRGPDGALLLSSNRVARFTGEVWLRRNAQISALSWASRVPEAAGGMLACDRLGCIYNAYGQIVALAIDGRALAEDCRLATAVVSIEPIRGRRCRDPRVVIDRFDLWRDGAHAIWLSPDEVRVESVREMRGDRPWVARRGWE